MLCHFYNDFFYFFFLWGHSFCDFYLKHSRWFFPLADNQWIVQHSDLSNTCWVACSPWLQKLSEIYTKWLIYSHLFLSDGSLLYQVLRAWGKLTPNINAWLHPTKILSLSSGTCQCFTSRHAIYAIKASQVTSQRWSCPLYVSLHFVIPISVISHSPKSRSSKL